MGVGYLKEKRIWRGGGKESRVFIKLKWEAVLLFHIQEIIKRAFHQI